MYREREREREGERKRERIKSLNYDKLLPVEQHFRPLSSLFCFFFVVVVFVLFLFCCYFCFFFYFGGFPLTGVVRKCRVFKF